MSIFNKNKAQTLKFSTPVISSQKKKFAIAQPQQLKFLKKNITYQPLNLKPCPFYQKNGYCNLQHKMLHQDCIQFKQSQFCSQQRCPFFHRKMCSQWKESGKCTNKNCQFLHKDCISWKNNNFCPRGETCPFYHRQKIKNEKLNNKNSLEQDQLQSNNKDQKLENHVNNEKKSSFMIKTKKSYENISNQFINIDNSQRKNSIKNTQNNLVSDEKNQLQQTPRKFTNNQQKALNNSLRSQSMNTSSDQQIQQESLIVQIQGEEEKKEQTLECRQPTVTGVRGIRQLQEARILSLSHQIQQSHNNLQQQRQRTDQLIAQLPNFNQIQEQQFSNISFDNSFEEEKKQDASQLESLESQSSMERELPSQQQQAFQSQNIQHQQQQQQQQQEQQISIQEREERIQILTDLSQRGNYLLDQLQRFEEIQRQSRWIAQVIGHDNPETQRLLRNVQSLVSTFDSIAQFARISAFKEVNEGIGQKDFEKLPINIYGITNDSVDGFNANTENSTKTICSICLEDYKVGDILKGLYCSHQFHEQCLKGWTEKKNVCPVCKMVINLK